jgi:NitT/TauT family transport system substrate-binding protein
LGTRGQLLRAVAGVLLSAIALAAAGCGGGSGGSPGGRTQLTLQLVPVGDVVPVHLGIKKGFFRREGIDIKIQTAQGGAVTVPLVINGSVQIGYSNTPTLLAAAAHGLPIEIVAPGGASPMAKQGNGADQVAAVMVKKNSSIRSPKDLAGKTVAVNTVKSLSDVTTSAALEKRGVDHRTVKYLEVPFPDMLSALDAGRVDAIYTVSPFKTLAEKSGKYRSILFPLLETRPGQVDAAYFVSKRWAAQNGKVLDRFLAALSRSMTYGQTHQAEMRRTLADYTQLPKSLIGVIPIGNRTPPCDELRASTVFLAQSMVRYGALERTPDLGKLIRPGFCAR